jgi:hypothetical protein
MAVGNTIEYPAARRAAEDGDADDMCEFCETHEANVPVHRRAGQRSMSVAAVLLSCMVGVALVAAAGVNSTERPRPEAELLSKADDALQGGKLHALAAALSRRNEVLKARRNDAAKEDDLKAAEELKIAGQAYAVKRSASKLVVAPRTMTRGKAEPAPAAVEEVSKAAGPKPEGMVHSNSVVSDIGNLQPTGIMGVFFNSHILLLALGIICTLLVAICLFARNCDCALT